MSDLENNTDNSISIRIGDLLEQAGLVTSADLAEAISVSKRLQLPIGRVLITSGCVTEQILRAAVQAQSLLHNRSIHLAKAIETLIRVAEDDISFQEALQKNDPIHIAGSSTGGLGEILIEFELISEQQLKRAITLSAESGLQLAATLVSMDLLSPMLLPLLLRTQEQIMDGIITRQEAAAEFKDSYAMFMKAEKSFRGTGSGTELQTQFAQAMQQKIQDPLEAYYRQFGQPGQYQMPMPPSAYGLPPGYPAPPPGYPPPFPPAYPPNYPPGYPYSLPPADWQGGIVPNQPSQWPPNQYPQPNSLVPPSAPPAPPVQPPASGYPIPSGGHPDDQHPAAQHPQPATGPLHHQQWQQLLPQAPPANLDTSPGTDPDTSTENVATPPNAEVTPEPVALPESTQGQPQAVPAHQHPAAHSAHTRLPALNLNVTSSQTPPATSSLPAEQAASAQASEHTINLADTDMPGAAQSPLSPAAAAQIAASAPAESSPFSQLPQQPVKTAKSENIGIPEFQRVTSRKSKSKVAETPETVHLVDRSSSTTSDDTATAPDPVPLSPQSVIIETPPVVAAGVVDDTSKASESEVDTLIDYDPSPFKPKKMNLAPEQPPHNAPIRSDVIIEPLANTEISKNVAQVGTPADPPIELGQPADSMFDALAQLRAAHEELELALDFTPQGTCDPDCTHNDTPSVTEVPIVSVRLGNVPRESPSASSDNSDHNDAKPAHPSSHAANNESSSLADVADKAQENLESSAQGVVENSEVITLFRQILKSQDLRKHSRLSSLWSNDGNNGHETHSSTAIEEVEKRRRTTKPKTDRSKHLAAKSGITANALNSEVADLPIDLPTIVLPPPDVPSKLEKERTTNKTKGRKKAAAKRKVEDEGQPLIDMLKQAGYFSESELTAAFAAALAKTSLLPDLLCMLGLVGQEACHDLSRCQAMIASKKLKPKQAIVLLTAIKNGKSFDEALEELHIVSTARI